MLFSYAIALGHDAIPHHHFHNAAELEHHHHHDSAIIDHDNHQVLVAETSDSEDHNHIFCHYSSAGDSKSVVGSNHDIKLIAKKILYPGIFSALPDATINIQKESKALTQCKLHFLNSSSHLLSSGLRAPPCRSNITL
jgi:hypothetical protein